MKIRKIHNLAGAALAACVLAASGASFAQSVPATGGTPSASPPTLVPPMKNPVPPMPDPPPTATVTPVPPMGTQGLTPAVPATQTPVAPNLAPAAPANQLTTGRSGIPSKSDNAITAFRSLDSANRGFVTRAETDRIPGFTGFDSADTDRDGHLTAEEFATAWKSYSGQ